MENEGEVRRAEPIVVLVHEETRGLIGLKIPEFGIELHGEDLPTLIELAEEQLWWRLEAKGGSIPDAATLVVTRVTREEFGPSCFEIEDEDE